MGADRADEGADRGSERERARVAIRKWVHEAGTAENSHQKVTLLQYKPKVARARDVVVYSCRWMWGML